MRSPADLGGQGGQAGLSTLPSQPLPPPIHAPLMASPEPGHGPPATPTGRTGRPAGSLTRPLAAPQGRLSTPDGPFSGCGQGALYGPARGLLGGDSRGGPGR